MKHHKPMPKQITEPPKPERKECSVCAYYGDEVCVRFPPTLFHTPAGMPGSRWPVVSPQDYCGEFKRRG